MMSIIITIIICIAVVNLYWNESSSQSRINTLKDKIATIEHDLAIVVNKLDKMEKDLNLFITNMRELVHRYGNSRYK